ncbi:MAG: ABC transporter permease [Verrucomicrobia bacterium]|nr:ABC transporter permease [Verrucomicrobiota bacterium]
MLKRILPLIWKELLAVLRDPKSRMAILVPPIIQLLIFASAATLDVKDVPIGILNRDSGVQAFDLVQRFHGTPFFSQIVYLEAVEEIGPFIDNQKGVMVVSIGEDFSRRLNQNLPAEVQLILDGRKSNTAQILSGYTTTIIQQFNADFSAQAGIPQQNVQLFPRFWFNPNALYSWFNIPSLVCTLTMLACLVVTTQSIARERELGTFDQLLVSPLSTREILVGKTIPGILVGMLEGTFLMVVGTFVYQVPFAGSLLLFFLSQFVFVCAISGVGLFISSLCSTQQQAMLGTFVFMLPAILLSGFATPIENMPSWLQSVTYLIPLRYMLVNTKGIFLKAIPADIVLSNTWPMALIAVFTLATAGFFFRKLR